MSKSATGAPLGAMQPNWTGGGFYGDIAGQALGGQLGGMAPQPYGRQPVPPGHDYTKGGVPRPPGPLAGAMSDARRQALDAMSQFQGLGGSPTPQGGYGGALGGGSGSSTALLDQIRAMMSQFVSYGGGFPQAAPPPIDRVTIQPSVLANGNAAPEYMIPSWLRDGTDPNTAEGRASLQTYINVPEQMSPFLRPNEYGVLPGTLLNAQDYADIAAGKTIQAQLDTQAQIARMMAGGPLAGTQPLTPQTKPMPNETPMLAPAPMPQTYLPPAQPDPFAGYGGYGGYGGFGPDPYGLSQFWQTSPY